MTDYGSKVTEGEIAEIERRLNRIYAQAEKEIEQKITAYTEKFNEQDEKYRKMVMSGDMTKADYDAWKRNKVFQGQVWQSKKDDIARTLTNSNQIANDLVNKKVDDVFAFNANYAAYQIEHDTGVSFGFDLYDKATVARLIKEEPRLLPKPKVDIPKDMAWNQKNIANQVTQGIIQGESIPKIAKRLSQATGSTNMKAMSMHARTAMTGAQNAGRLRRFRDAQDLGIDLKKEWLAAHDSRTRDLHIELDGERVPIDEPFEINGYEVDYPGDPGGEPEMVYNCRCTMIADVEKYPSAYRGARNDDLKDMNYDEWEEQQEQPVLAPLEVNKLKGAMNTADYNEFIQSVESADNQDLRNLYQVYGDECKGYYLVDSSRSYYSPGNDTVHFGLNNRDSQMGRYEVLGHEAGHMFDAHIGKMEGMNYKEMESINNKWIEWYQDRFNTNEMPKHMMIREVASSSDEFLAAIRKDKEHIKAIINEKGWHDVYVELGRNDASAGVQDAIDGMFNKRINWGHGSAYYNREYNRKIKGYGFEKDMKDAYISLGYDASNQAKVKMISRDYDIASEAFANISGAEVVGGEALEYFREYMPNSLQAFRDIIGKVK